jgi:hypothetical protein
MLGVRTVVVAAIEDNLQLVLSSLDITSYYNACLVSKRWAAVPTKFSFH